jgi:hypothetical protein
MNPPFVREKIITFLKSKVLVADSKDLTGVGADLSVNNVLGSSFLLRVKEPGGTAEYFEVKVTHKII